MQGLSITTLKGEQIHPYIRDLAQLRIKIFREYPFLYEGDIQYEQEYLNVYMQNNESVLVLVRDDSEVVGASTAIPLIFETPECQKPFHDENFNIADIFYFGESVLLPEYRHKGVYKHFFKEREASAIAYGSKVAAFCTVAREQNDPRRPKYYVPLDTVWTHFGYQKHPNLCAYYEWKEIDHTEKTTKPMLFWTKTL